MAATIKFTWPQFDGMDYLELGIMLDGSAIGELNLPATAVEQEFAAIEAPHTRYAANVRGVTPIVPCSVQLIDGGGGSGSGSGGG